jgi:ketosteroid isomerase-like protein
MEISLMMRRPVSLVSAIVLLLGVSGGTLFLNAKAKSPGNDEAAIKALYSDFNNAFSKKDVGAIMACYAPDVFAFDVIPPREYPNWDAYKKDWEGLFAAFPGPVTTNISELKITVVGSIAYSRSIDDATFTAKDGSKIHMVVRVTGVLRKSNGKWLIVQEHVSVPVDPTTGKADLLSAP